MVIFHTSQWFRNRIEGTSNLVTLFTSHKFSWEHSNPQHRAPPYTSLEVTSSHAMAVPHKILITLSSSLAPQQVQCELQQDWYKDSSIQG